MCVGIPGKVVLVKGNKAKIKQGGHFHWVDISSISGEVKEGDYLLTYLDAAVNKISKEDAQQVLDLMDSASDTGIKSSD
jgi:hydrogenase assembly chaperone HypC/HupF